MLWIMYYLVSVLYAANAFLVTLEIVKMLQKQMQNAKFGASNYLFMHYFLLSLSLQYFVIIVFYKCSLLLTRSF